ncbi:adenine methyltransferase [Lactococcus muris]|uniref:adenine methyltransferase n=1 Tax=Lactococcus muris TaxID=2941330 RepID=UPI00373FDE16
MYIVLLNVYNILDEEKAMLYNQTAQHSTAQHSTAQHSTAHKQAVDCRSFLHAPKRSG